MLSQKTLRKLRIRVLPDRKLSIAGKIAKAILMPKSGLLQYIIIKRLIKWYSPCLQDQGKIYSLNNTCYMIRQNELLNMFQVAHQSYWRLRLFSR